MKNILILLFLFHLSTWGTSAQQSHCKNHPVMDSLRISQIDLPKYKEAYNYVLSDSINQGRDIFVSDIIIDMDRFYFESEVKNDSVLTATINSLTKYHWFEDFSSTEIKQLFEEQNAKAESIVFFSLIEKNTLRADLFIKRHNISEFKYDKLILWNRAKVYAYLFIFDETDKIKHAFRHEIIYGI